MTPVVRMSLTGPFAGVPRVLNHVQGDHRWMLRFRAELADGGADECEVSSSGPIPLSALNAFAKEAVDEVIAGHGARGLVVKSCEWTAFALDGKRAAKRRARR